MNEKEMRALVVLYNGIQTHEKVRERLVSNLINFADAETDSIQVYEFDSAEIVKSMISKKAGDLEIERIATNDRHIEAAVKFISTFFDKVIKTKNYTKFAIELTLALRKAKTSEEEQYKALLSACDILITDRVKVHPALLKYGLNNKVLEIIKDCVYVYHID